MPSDSLENTTKLKDEAKKLLQDSSILNTLSDFGETELTGSVLYDLMAWPDIDIHVYSPDLSKRKALDVLGVVFSDDFFKRAEIVSSDVVAKGVNFIDGSYYIRTKKLINSRKWNFDIWLFPLSKDEYYRLRDSELPQDWYAQLSESRDSQLLKKNSS